MPVYLPSPNEGVGNELPDTDGDGLPDSVEAGDADLMTPPAVCEFEVNPVTGELAGDGDPDFVDNDSDNDGAGDGREIEYGTDPCDVDSDDDGLGDLVEIAYEQVNCPPGTAMGEGEGCGCATSMGCGIPEDDYFLVLPFGGEPQTRDLDFSTTIRVADVFFLTDTTGSMGSTLSNVKATVAAGDGSSLGSVRRFLMRGLEEASTMTFPLVAMVAVAMSPLFSRLA